MRKVFRLFVSSTFNDFRAERQALQHRVFPQLARLCAERGALFQPVDLRWGVSRAAAESHQAMAICLQEVDRCAHLSAGPYFLAMVGERYGWRPVPSEIPCGDFERIESALGARGRSLLKRWYRRDDNAIVPVYLLRQQPDDPSAWVAIARDLSEVLRIASESFSEAQRLRYVASATEQEIDRGVFSVADPQGRTFAYLRRFESAPARARERREYLDTEANAASSAFAAERLERLRARLVEKLPHGVIHGTAGRQGRGVDEPCVQHFEHDVLEMLSAACVAALELGGPDATEEESAAHERFRLGRVAHADGTPFFKGRRTYLRAIERYLSGTVPQPLVLHGVSGVGKSALMAQAIGIARGGEIALIQRFAGATPASTGVRSLLASLCSELRRIEGKRFAQTGDSYEELAREFAERLSAIAATRRVAVFIDALDQLRDLGDPPRLQWISKALPANARLVLSSVDGRMLEALQQHLPSSPCLTLRPMPKAEGASLLTDLLRQAGRTLQPAQHALAERRFAQSGLPIYFRLAFEELRRLRSYERLVLPADVPRLVWQLADRLSRPVNHGEMLVERSFAYLLASRDGLADDEMLGLLSRDREVMADFARRSPDSPKVRDLPQIVWTRLYFDLAPYLATTPGGGTLLLRFYHRQFGAAVELRHADRSRHAAMARYFAEQGLRTAAAPTAPPNERTLIELPYQLARAGDTLALQRLLGSFDFLQTKVQALGPNALLEDYAYCGAGGLAIGTDLEPIARALKRAAHVLDQDRLQTGAQLLGRLLDESSRRAARLAAQASAWSARHWLRPLSASLAISGPLVQTLTAAAEHINGLAVAPSGRFLVSCANEGAVRVWDLATGSETRVLESHTQWVKDVAVMPDERRVLSVSFDRTLRIWNLDTYDPPQVLRLGGRAWSIALFPGGRRCAVAAGKFVQVWDLEECRLVARGRGHREEVTRVAITGNGARVVSLAEDQTVRVWDAVSMKPIRILRGEDVDPQRYWKETKGGGRQSMHPEWTPYALAVTPDGHGVLAARRDHTIRLRSLDTGRETARLLGHEGTVDSVAVDPRGELAVSGGWDRTLRIWRLPAGELHNTLRYGTATIGPVVFAPDGRTVYTGTGSREILAWDLAAAQSAARPESAHPEHDAPVTALCTTSKWLVSASRDGSICVWDPRNERRVRRLDFEGSVSALTTTPDGQTLYATGLGKYGRKTSRGPLSDGGELEYVSFMYGGMSDFQQIQFTPNGRRLVACSLDGTWVLNIDTGKVESELELYSRWIAISPDGAYVLGAHKLDVCRVPIGGGPRETLFRPRNEARKAVLIGDGTRLACFSLEGDTEIWPVVAPPRAPLLRLPGRSVAGVATADGHQLITLRRESQIVWWDLKSGAALARFNGVGPMSACAITPDGKTLVAGEDTGRLHVLHLEMPRG
ncbi:MAG TPA: DUF4062 domain-containing protein [Burkholderiaceae bacterium]|nr:DUF4062 domain-containing protein [Burkholderiaceae bacterium]